MTMANSDGAQAQILPSNPTHHIPTPQQVEDSRQPGGPISLLTPPQPSAAAVRQPKRAPKRRRTHPPHPVSRKIRPPHITVHMWSRCCNCTSSSTCKTQRYLQQYLLRHGGASRWFCQTIAKMAEWLANTSLLWARYRSIMASRLIALDKCPGVCPIGVGKTLRRLLAKCILAVAGKEAKLACGTD